MATITTRAGKGSALTFTELDANFNNLNNGKIEAGTGAIVNADVNAAAAIDGSKINPAFGNQQITSTTSTGLAVGSPYQTTVDRNYLIIGNNKGNTDGTSFIRLVADTTYTSSEGGVYIGREQGANANSFIEHRGTGALYLKTREAGTLVFQTSNTERGRFSSDGRFTISPDANGSPGGGNTNTGLSFANGEALHVSRANSTPVVVNLSGGDGSLQDWNKDGVFQGNVTILTGTVSYNPFLGSHWSRMEDDSQPEIPVGTIMETVDKIVTWRKVRFTVSEREMWKPWVGPEPTGTTVEFDYDGITYSGVIEEELDPSGLEKHVCAKISDTARSKAVYGVFLGWHNKAPDQLMTGDWPDMSVASVGNYFVRMDAGETPQIGDYVESAGNGCARVQADDILRASTVAKVTSTIPQRVYPDGSFLVTCTLHCG